MSSIRDHDQQGRRPGIYYTLLTCRSQIVVRSQAFTACKSLSFFFVSLSNICPSIGRGPTRRASLEAGVASSRGFSLLLLLVLTRDAKQTQNGYKGGSGKANGHLEMEDPCLRRSIEFNRSLAESLQADAVPGSLRWPYRRTDYRFATTGKKAALGVLATVSNQLVGSSKACHLCFSYCLRTRNREPQNTLTAPFWWIHLCEGCVSTEPTITTQLRCLA